MVLHAIPRFSLTLTISTIEHVTTKSCYKSYLSFLDVVYMDNVIKHVPGKYYLLVILTKFHMSIKFYYYYYIYIYTLPARLYICLTCFSSNSVTMMTIGRDMYLYH